VRRLFPVRGGLPRAMYLHRGRGKHRYAGERYARVYNIDYSRCIFCGYCVEACPTDAITHGHGFELATSNINSMIYRKEKLLEKAPTAP
jgi:NADH-quinone oxidoreductase subunit I